MRVKACRRGPMMYFASDQYVGRSFDLYGEFSEGETVVFAQVLKPGMVAIDAGANIGAHTVFFAKAVGPSGRVYAFEPQRRVHQMLCGNVALNALGNVSCLHTALGATAGSVTIPPIEYDKGGNFGGLALGRWESGETVPVMTLDSLALETCHFIKIDVEGMERDVLQGTTATLARCKPFLYVENDREKNSAALIQWLLDHDYRLYWHLTPLFNPNNHFGTAENVFGGILSINKLGIPKSTTVNLNGFREILSADDTWRSGTG